MRALIENDRVQHVILTFTMLNLFIAIIVNAMQAFHKADMHEEVRGLRADIAALKAVLHGGPGSV